MTDHISTDPAEHSDENSFDALNGKKIITNDAIENAYLIDEKQLKDLINLIGMDTFDAIMDDFRSEITQRFEILNNQGLDLDQLARELHIVTSCGGNLGMSKFSLLARQIMNKIDRHEEIDAPAQIKTLQNVYADSLRMFLFKKDSLKNSSIEY